MIARAIVTLLAEPFGFILDYLPGANSPWLVQHKRDIRAAQGRGRTLFGAIRDYRRKNALRSYPRHP